MRKERCSNCGAEARVVRGAHHFKEIALKNVTLMGVKLIQCPTCGNEDVVIPRVNEVMRVLAMAVVNKPYRLAGHEVRFLRKFLGMTGEEFARLLHVEKTTLSKWENDDPPIGQQSDLLVRSVALALGEGLQGRQAEVVRQFERITKQPRHALELQVDPQTMSYRYA